MPDPADATKLLLQTGKQLPASRSCATTARPPAAAGSIPAATPRRATTWRAATPPTRDEPAPTRNGRSPGRPTGASCTIAPRRTCRASPGIPTRKLIEWDGTKWTGYDVPDIAPTAKPDAGRPFIMNPEGTARLWVARPDADGPFPDALRAVRKPGRQPDRAEDPRQSGGARVHGRPAKPSATSTEFPYVGDDLPADRALPLLDEARRGSMRSCSRSSSSRSREELAKEKGIENGGWVRGLVEARLRQGQGGRHEAHQAADVRRQDRSTSSACRCIGASSGAARKGFGPMC